MRIYLAATIAAVVIASVIWAGASQAAPPNRAVPKPKPLFASGAVQVGAHGSLAGLPVADRAEMQLGHACPIQVPSASNAAYSYSLVGKTSNGWQIRMGYIVLQSDGANASCYLRDGSSRCCSGWARWFIQVYDGAGREVYWNLSRAGEANPPPAASASSGDDTVNGYPFSFVLSGNTASFYFDWISKARVRLSNPGVLTDVYYVGDLDSALPSDSMGPRTALTTYRVWNGGPSWIEPSPATALYFGAQCPPFGVAYVGRSPSARRDGVKYHSTAAGSGTACSDPGSVLWHSSTN
jgi:hypothetical protein